MTIVEAFACGVPVIASDIGSTAEVVRNDVGLRFQAGNVEELSTALRWAMAHPKEIFSMGTRARTLYERKYTAHTNYQLLMQTYRAALDRISSTEPLRIEVPLRKSA
jgi:glycosyltransferase involved in cell wall biosynthesis